MPQLPISQTLLLAAAIAAACALPGCKRASEAIAEKAIEQASGDKVDIKQDGGNIFNVKGGTNLADVVKALNTLGANPLELIAILQAMKASGALRAELEVI